MKQLYMNTHTHMYTNNNCLSVIKNSYFCWISYTFVFFPPPPPHSVDCNLNQLILFFPPPFLNQNCWSHYANSCPTLLVPLLDLRPISELPLMNGQQNNKHHISVYLTMNGRCLKLFVDSMKEAHMVLLMKNWIIRCKQQRDDDFKAQLNANKTHSITGNLTEKYFLEGMWKLTIKEKQSITVFILNPIKPPTFHMH